MDVAIPAGLAEILVYLLLDGRRDEALTIAKLIIVGATMAVDEVLTHVRLHPFGHVVIEDVHHALGKLHLLGLAEKGAVGRAYILETGIDSKRIRFDALQAIVPSICQAVAPCISVCLQVS